MADAQLRLIAREAAQGDLEAQARLLQARVRVGELTDERLRLAAFLGDPAARVALGPEAPDRVSELGEWGFELAAWGREGPVRAMVAATLAVSPLIERTRKVESLHQVLLAPAIPEALDAIERWLGSPDTVSRRLVIRAVSRLNGAFSRIRREFWSGRPRPTDRQRLLGLQGSVLTYAAHVISGANEQVAPVAASGLRTAGLALEAAGVARHAAQAALGLHLLPWVLGEQV